jgi:SRSO17 transposase
MVDLDRRRRFAAYVEALSPALGRVGRNSKLEAYCAGLLSSGRKSIEPLAERLGGAVGLDQRLHQFVANANWSDEAMLAAVRRLVLPAMSRHTPVQAWVIDEVGFVKKGVDSVGVARQSCATLGGRENCQVAVTLSLASARGSLPIAYRLVLPPAWADDRERRRKAGVPDEVTFQIKPEHALEAIRAAMNAGAPKGVVLAGPEYGNDAEFRAGLAALGLTYALGVDPALPLWTEDQWYGIEGPAVLDRHDPDVLVTAHDLLMHLPERRWAHLWWRDSFGSEMPSDFAAVRVTPADGAHAAPEWLVIQARLGKAPNAWLSTLANPTRFLDFMERASLAQRVRRDLDELTHDIGLSHYEGRGWRGFHHHGALCIAAFGFSVLERNRSS